MKRSCRALGFVLRFFLFSAVLLGAALMLGRIFFPPEALSAGTAEAERVTVILDPGHGGRDGGAHGEDGTLEKDLNLSVSKKLAELLALADVNVVMTRDRDIELADPSSSHKKRDDLNARLAMTKQYDRAVLVSIHMNKFPVEKYSGLQVYYSQNHKGSLVLAETVQKNAVSLRQENARQVKAAGDNIFLLHHAAIPAVLVECGFLSNPTERELLKNEDYQMGLAMTLASSILDYLTENLI